MARSSFAATCLARLFNSLGGGWRRRLLWLAQAKFNLGVAGIIRDPDGQVLLVRHRFWKGHQWGLPGGYAHHGETAAETLRREVREETGLEITPTRMRQVVTGEKLRAEFILLADCAEPRPEVCSAEIMDARFCALEELPIDLLPAHRRLLEALAADPAPKGLALE